MRTSVFLGKMNTAFISIPNESILYIYRTQGLLKQNDGTSTKVRCDIAEVIAQCCGGMPLYDSVVHYSEINNLGQSETFKLVAGISELCVKNKLEYSRVPVQHTCKIIREDNAFYPESIHLELTKRCNFHCNYCYRSSAPDIVEERMTTAESIQLIRNLADRGLKVIELTGGEPLLHPDFWDILDVCCANLTLVSILSNGYLIDEGFIERIRQYKNKVLFSISLDSYIPEEHDYHSGVKGSFDHAVNAIKLIAKENILVRAAMAVDEKSWNHVEDTLLFARSIGAATFSYSPILPFGRAKQSYGNWESLDAKDVYFQEKELIRKYKDFIQVLDEKTTNDVLSQGGCGAGWRNFAISPSGNVRLCVSYDEDFGVIGNVLRQDLQTVFSHPLCKLSSEIIPPNAKECGNCEKYFFCNGCNLRALTQIRQLGQTDCNWSNNPKVREFLNLLETPEH